MPPVFGHGRLRLYLLKLLGESPRHGYEVIRLLEGRFLGLYAPSAGTVYPRLAKLEAEGLVTHADEGGRKVYALTEEGRRELGTRESELTELEREIRASLAAMAPERRADDSGPAGGLRQESGEAIRKAGTAGERPRRTGDDAAAAREHVEQVGRHIQVWRRAVRESLEGPSHEIGGHGRLTDVPSTPWPVWPHEPEEADEADEAEESADPARELERLLDRFRDDVRDAAHDHGVTQEQLRAARRHLSTTAAHLVALLHTGGGERHGQAGPKA